MEANDSVHIVSWNVAGFKPTFEKIEKRFGSLEALMKRLSIDILCLQEVKLSKQTISDTPGNFGAKNGGPIQGFFAVSSKKKNGGEAGVATFCRAGMCASATSELGVYSDAGRFIQTDHGDFVLINVYVYNDGQESKNLSVKMDFLLQVRERLRELRASGRRVVALGDWNLKVTSLDSAVGHRTVRIQDMLQDEPHPNDPDLLKEIRSVLSGEGLGKFQESCLQVEATKRQTRFTHRIRSVNGSLVRLSVDPSDVSLENLFQMQGREVAVLNGNNGGLLLSESRNWISAPKLALPLTYLVESVRAVFQTFDQPSLESLREFGNLDRPWITAGRPCSTAFAQSLLLEDEMVDSFRFIHGKIKDRFTCWSQYTNARYSNSGSRLDYIFVDQSLLPQIEKGSISLDGCICEAENCIKEWECALRAATSNGRWRPAPMEGGGGLPDGPESAYSDFIRLPHSGIIYFPPEYSDHVGASLVLRSCRVSAANLTLEKSAATRNCQPHCQQKSILDMFSRTPPVPKKAVSKPVASEPIAKKPKSEKEAFQNYFRK